MFHVKHGERKGLRTMNGPQERKASHGPRILTVANQKGGVGKTTTAVNLAAALGDAGRSVLIIDLDPQANATTGLGISAEKVELSTYDVLISGAHLADCVIPTSYPNLSIAPALVDLAGAEVELVPEDRREHRLRDALLTAENEFAFVFIDCPPSLGLLTLNGFVAATEVLLPIQCEYYALEGVSQLVHNVELIRQNLNPSLAISTVVLTMFDARTKLTAQVARDVRDHFGDRVMRAVIPRSVRISEAPSYGQPIGVFDPLSRGALAYRQLAEEMLQHD